MAMYAILSDVVTERFEQPFVSPCRGNTTTIMPNNRRMNPRLMEDVSGLLQREQSGLASAEAAVNAATTAKSAAQAGERTAKRVCLLVPVSVLSMVTIRIRFPFLGRQSAEGRSIWISSKSFSMPFCERAIAHFSQSVRSGQTAPVWSSQAPYQLPYDSHTTLAFSIS